MGTYGPGIALEDVDDGYDSDNLTEAEKQLVCQSCKRKGHKMKTNKRCPYYVPRKRKPKTTVPVEKGDASTTQQVATDAADADRMDGLAFTVAVGSDDEFFDTDEFAEESNPWDTAVV